MNKLPKVKRFLKEQGGYDLYEGVTIEWISHHNPDLQVYDGSTIKETIDLSGYSTEGLHVLFRKYFSLKSAARQLLEAPLEAQPEAPAAEVAVNGSLHASLPASFFGAHPLPHDAASTNPGAVGKDAADTTAGAASPATQTQTQPTALDPTVPTVNGSPLRPFFLPCTVLLFLLMFLLATKLRASRLRRHKAAAATASDPVTELGCHVA